MFWLLDLQFLAKYGPIWTVSNAAQMFSREALKSKKNTYGQLEELLP